MIIKRQIRSSSVTPRTRIILCGIHLLNCTTLPSTDTPPTYVRADTTLMEFHRCRAANPVGQYFTMNIENEGSCSAGQVFNILSAEAGYSSIYIPTANPPQCPSNTCARRIDTPAELCNGRPSCNIPQSFLIYPQGSVRALCASARDGNFIRIKFTCVTGSSTTTTTTTKSSSTLRLIHATITEESNSYSSGASSVSMTTMTSLCHGCDYVSTTTKVSDNQSQGQSDKNAPTLSTGAIAGISVGVAVLVIIVVIAIIVVRQKLHRMDSITSHRDIPKSSPTPAVTTNANSPSPGYCYVRPHFHGPKDDVEDGYLRPQPSAEYIALHQDTLPTPTATTDANCPPKEYCYVTVLPKQPHVSQTQPPAASSNANTDGYLIPEFYANIKD